MTLLPYPMHGLFRLHASSLLFHRMVRGNNTQNIYLGSMDDEEFLPQAVAVFLGCHPTNVTQGPGGRRRTLGNEHVSDPDERARNHPFRMILGGGAQQPWIAEEGRSPNLTTFPMESA